LILTDKPVDIARKDYLEFFIEEILEWRDKKRVSNFSFMKMVGLRRDIQLVGTLENVRDMDKVHDYLRANNMELYTKEVQNKYISFLSRLLLILFFL
jgi:hypothetical protein